MPKITATGVSHADETVDAGEPAIVVDEHGDDAAVADTPAAPKPAPRKK